MRLEDYERKVHEDVGGLYKKGNDDNIPEDHFADSLNIWHEISEWRTRPGLSSSIFLGYQGNVRRFAFFNGIILILDDQGNLYTYSGRSFDTATTPLINIPGAVDFSAVKLLGKIFLAFHDGQFGLSGVNLKLYIPDPNLPTNDIIRDAAGLAPIATTPLVAVDGAAGEVNAGTYQIAVSFITSTGYITQPGPKIGGIFTATSFTAAGAKKLNLSNIPVGPAGTTQRQILISKVGLTELFFVASAFGGIINDNVTTTAILNFNDTLDLVSSAEYLFTLLETIPAPLVMHPYNGKLIIGGEFANPSILRGSRTGDVESIDSISGIYFVNKDDGFVIRNLFQMRSTLYIWKNLGAWYVTDNGNDLSTWPEASSFDENVGIPVHGIGEFYNNSDVRIARDWTIVADRSGILLFNGSLQKPQVTNKISGIWSTLNFFQFHKVVLVVDEQCHKIYCTLPVNGSNDCNLFLAGDYSLCPGKVPESTKIRWSIWSISPCGTTRRVTALGMFNYLPDAVPTLKIGSIDGTGKIYTLDPNTAYDDGFDINTMFESSLLYWEPGFVHFFTASRLRVTGFGSLSNSIRGEDNSNQANIPPIVLSALDYRFYTELVVEGAFDGVNEQYRICYHANANFIFLFQNGLLIQNGVDYNILGNLINMSLPPQPNDTLQAIYLIGTVTTTYILETPTGTINGINNLFNCTNDVPLSEQPFVLVWQNGLLLRNGIDFLFGIVNNHQIAFNLPPLVNDSIQVLYHKDVIQTGYITEDKTATIDGSTNLFSLVNTPGFEFMGVFQNGLLLRKFIDYQLVGTNIILSATPLLNDTLQFMYRKAIIVSGNGREQLIRFNFQNEKAKLKFNMVSGKMTVNKIEYFGKETYPMRPM